MKKQTMNETELELAGLRVMLLSHTQDLKEAIGHLIHNDLKLAVRVLDKATRRLEKSLRKIAENHGMPVRPKSKAKK